MKKLINLDYSYDAFDDVIDSSTMQIHHTKHLNAYLTNYNNAIEGTEFEGKEVEEVLRNINLVDESIRTIVRNNGGGVLNHNLYFTQLKKNVALQEGPLKNAIVETFGSVENLEAELLKASMARFGSGWAWLVLDGGKLKVISTPNQDNPVMDSYIPLLGIDVWEHAYYLKYQNLRADYVKALLTIIDWSVIEIRYIQGL